MKIEQLPEATESVEQQRLMQWARMESGKWPELALLYHVPNEGKRSRTAGARMKAEGKNIARRWHDRRIIIKPETTQYCCLIWVEGSRRPPAVRWNPDADDLISDAWEVTGDWYEP